MKKSLFLVLLIGCAILTYSDDGYKAGLKAYSNNDYVTALEYLFSYRTANAEMLRKNPDTKKKLDDAIAFCENYLKDAIRRADETYKFRVSTTTFGYALEQARTSGIRVSGLEIDKLASVLEKNQVQLIVPEKFQEQFIQGLGELSH